MKTPESSFSVHVDATNPGEFFACCGLLELAGRLWDGVTARFRRDDFVIESPRTSEGLADLLRRFQNCELYVSASAGEDRKNEDEEEGGLANPMTLGSPFDLRLDWWADKSLKPWAGSMNAELIFKAMRSAISPDSLDPFNDLRVVHDEAPESSDEHRSRKPKKREPFYFDARRGANAKSLDVGFAPDAVNMASVACPAVEALCLVGLQRFRPEPTGKPRVFDYCTWSVPLPLGLAAAAACGRLPGVGTERYRFENAFRTDQRKHKGFLAAARIVEGDTP